MGTNVSHTDFCDADFAQCSGQLQRDIDALKLLLGRTGFAEGPCSIGSELELSLIDERGQAKWINQQLQELAQDPQLTLELNRYNLEYNLSPVFAQGKPFTQIQTELELKLKQIADLALSFGARPVPIGILPTVTKRDISSEAMTDSKRYRVLTEKIIKMRGSPFEISINGKEPLFLTLQNLNAEGANTSFQVHLRVDPKRFANTYNAAQLVLAPVLSVATNSPIFLQHRLWEETRIPLFKQAVETRTIQENKQGCISRTGLGKGWVKDSALELFQQSINEFNVIFPECEDEDSVAIAKAGSIPQLAALRLHHGSVWHWNRAIYDPAAGGHLRIEMRILPSGPTPIDMAANAAFMIGAVLGLAKDMPTISALISARLLKFNYYRAAQWGMDANILWPNRALNELNKTPVLEILQELLPIAKTGLASIDVEDDEIHHYLGIIEHRIAAQTTGARWQLKNLAHFEAQLDRTSALQKMVNAYFARVSEGAPIHEWS